MRRSITYTTAIAVLTIVALIALPLAASAGPAVLTGKATGSVGMSMQYVSFDAFDYAAPAVDRGNVTYTNFGYGPVTGSGVWVPQGQFNIDFYLGLDGPYPHVMVIDSFMPLSTDSVSFEAHGWYLADPTWTWTATGAIDGNMFSFAIDHVLMTPDPFNWTMLEGSGTIAPDGTISGSAIDNFDPPRSLTWRIAAGAVHEVLSYSAPVTCAVVNKTASTASFGYTIPTDFAVPAEVPFAGSPIVMNVFDGGTPGTDGDTIALGGGTCGGAGTGYQITSGNLVVHK